MPQPVTSAPAARPKTISSGSGRAWLVLVVALLVAGSLLRIHFFAPTMQRSPDEFTFTRQANLLLSLGSPAVRLLGSELLARPEVMALQPSPARVGYLGVLAAFMRITHDRTVLAGARLSLLCSIGTIIALAGFAYRRFSPQIAALATLFYAVLPFDLVVSRRAWQDSFIAWMALLVLITAVALVRSTSRWTALQLAAFTLLGVACITTKANLAGIYFLCAAGVAFHLFRQHRNRAAALVCAAGGTACALSALLVSELFGSLHQCLLIVRAVNRYAFSGIYDAQYNSGSLWMFAAGFLRACPLVICAAIAGTLLVLLRLLRTRGTRLGLSAAIAALAWSIPIAQAATRHYDYRYTAPAYSFLCLLAAIGIAEIIPSFQRALPSLSPSIVPAALAACMAIAALRDVDFATSQFLDTAMQDLSLRMVLGLPPLTVSASTLPSIAPETAAAAESTPQNQIDRSLALIRANQPGRALPILDSVLADDPHNAVAWNNRCAANNMLMYYGEAIADCTRALRVSPDFLLARNNLRWAQDQLASVQREIAAEKNIPAPARNRSYYLTLGLNLLHAGVYDQAIAAWKHALALVPSDSAAANNIGTAYMFKHQPAEAVRWFQKAATLDPASQLARNNLAWAQSVLQTQTQP